MELAGEIADGLHTACAYSPEALGYAVKHFRLEEIERDAEIQARSSEEVLVRTNTDRGANQLRYLPADAPCLLTSPSLV